MARNKLNGYDLDYKLQDLLKTMVIEGHVLSPISRSSVQSRLGLKSRGTLSVEFRAKLIENARISQLKASGLTVNEKKPRNTLIEQIEHLKGKLSEAVKERDSAIEKLALIVTGIQAKGYNSEELMKPLLKL